MKYNILSSGVIREYKDHIDFYLNNFRNDTTTRRIDVIRIHGMNAEPTLQVKKHGDYYASVNGTYNEEKNTYTVNVRHLGPVEVSIFCQGSADRKDANDAIPSDYNLPLPKQPLPFNGNVIIEAENMDYKDVKNVAFTHSGWWAPDYNQFAGLGYVEMGTNTQASLRHELNLKEGGEYEVAIRYCNTTKSGDFEVSINGEVHSITLDKVKKNEWTKIKVPVALKEGTNTLILTNAGGTSPVIDQILYIPKGSEEEKFLVTVRESENGTVKANLSEASEGEKVILTVTPQEGYALKELKIVNSVFYSMSATIEIGESGEISFIMPDDNVTIQPVFVDTTSVYKLDYTNVANGTIPEGWQCIQENNEIHEYPQSYGMGARTFKDFIGFQGKALYWRNGRAEYGVQSNYPLTLEAGNYKLTFAMAAWKGQPNYNIMVRKYNSDKSTAQSEVFTTKVSAEGNTSADLSAEEQHEFEFSIPEAGNYVVSFIDKTNGGGYHEFLLLECKLNYTGDTGVDSLTEGVNRVPAGIYTPQGLKISSMQPGLNIVIDTDGTVKKVMKK